MKNTVFTNKLLGISETKNERRLVHNKETYSLHEGRAVAQLVESLRYKMGGRGFDSQWGKWNSSVT
jgi:hypothetical protein